MSTPILLSWSGGKDCLLALVRLRADPRWRVVGLLTSVTRRFDRVAMHGIRRDVLEAQAAALGLPLVTAELDSPSTNESYKAAFAAALQAAHQRWPELEHMAFGDIAPTDVRAWREQQMAEQGWQCEFPVWGEDTAALARHFIDAGHRARIACVDTAQLAAHFAGREFDAALLGDLPASVDACGENGEFHTVSFAGPMFSHALALERGDSVLRDERFQYSDFLLADARHV